LINFFTAFQTWISNASLRLDLWVRLYLYPGRGMHLSDHFPFPCLSNIYFFGSIINIWCSLFVVWWSRAETKNDIHLSRLKCSELEKFAEKIFFFNVALFPDDDSSFVCPNLTSKWRHWFFFVWTLWYSEESFNIYYIHPFKWNFHRFSWRHGSK